MGKDQFEQASKNLYEKMIVDDIKGIMQYKPFSDEYWKYDELYQSMKDIMYMNFRPKSAKGNKQEIGETHKIIRKYKSEIKAYIQSLDADIFVLSTKDAVSLFNYVFDIKDKALVFKKEKRIDNMLIFSVKHFGRPKSKK